MLEGWYHMWISLSRDFIFFHEVSTLFLEWSVSCWLNNVSWLGLWSLFVKQGVFEHLRWANVVTRKWSLYWHDTHYVNRTGKVGNGWIEERGQMECFANLGCPSVLCSGRRFMVLPSLSVQTQSPKGLPAAVIFSPTAWHIEGLDRNATDTKHLNTQVIENMAL